MKVIILCSYPPRFVTNDKFSTSKQNHVSSWNINLINSLSKIQGLEITVLSNGAYFKTKSYIKNNIKFIYVSKIPILDKYFPILRRWRFQRYINKISPDIVHGIGNEHLYPWFAIKSGYKNIITAHGILSKIVTKPNYVDRLRIKYERYSFKNAEHIISIAKSINSEAKKYNSDINLYEINNAISETFFDKKYQIKSKDYDIMLVGMVYPLKNIHLIIPIVEKIKKIKSNIKIGIIGGPIPAYQSYYDKIVTNIKEKSLDRNIHFLGQIENKNIPENLSKSKILLHLSKQETSPMVIIESLALGLFVISNNVGNVSDIITNKNGKILENLDIDYVCNHIIESLDNLKPSNLISEDIYDKHHPTKVATQTYNVYRKLI